MEEIKVTVVKFGDQKFLQMQYKDPITGRKQTKSSGTTNRREAERASAKLEAELREGRYKPASKITWAEFRRRYEDEVLTSLAKETDHKVQTVFGLLESLINPGRLRDLTAARISTFQSQLRAGKRSENTIDGYMAHLMAALNWAVSIGLLPEAPTVKRPKRRKDGKTMKGRPITLEELERMLDKVPQEVGEQAAPSWKEYLEGLWQSGLRLEESLELWWDRDDRLQVVVEGRHPMLRIPRDFEKGNKDRMLPMAPEFAEFLERIPTAERTGRVFKLVAKRAHGERLTRDRVSRIISAIGKAAKVKVHTYSSGKVKYASAHDLRRSFGERWSTRVMPPILQQLMRHESIETTLKYYVGRNAQLTASILWEAYEKAVAGNTSGNTTASDANTADRASDSSSTTGTGYEVGPEGFEPPTKGL